MPRKIIILILINIFLAACNSGPSEAEINARIAAQVQAEQTADVELFAAVKSTIDAEQTRNAPTLTPTPTNTPTPTPTPTEEPLGTSNLFIEYILDGSGSMYDTLPDGTTKLDIARKVLIEQLQAFHPETNIGLRAYGHRVSWEQNEEESCNDIELVASVQPGQIERIATWLDEFDPKGMTPLAESLQRAVTDLVFEPSRINSIVMLTDGIETCGGDPCQLVADLQKRGINFKLHVIGLDVDEPTREQLLCIAKAAGGVYHDTKSQQDLDKALQGIQKDVTKDEVIVPHGVDTPTPLPTVTPTETPVPTATATAVPPVSAAGRIVYLSGETYQNDIYSMNPDGSDKRQITYKLKTGMPYAPALSRDGTKIAVPMRELTDPKKPPTFWIRIMDINGNVLNEFLHRNTPIESPVWHPNGQNLTLFLSIGMGDASYSGDLYNVSIDGNQQQLTFNPELEKFYASWAPDGSQFAYMNGYQLFIANADGSGSRKVVDGFARDVVWSPDGSKIAFESGSTLVRNTTTFANMDIWVVNPDGSELRNILNTPGVYDGSPTWSPDGTKLAFDSIATKDNRDRKGSHIKVVDINTGEITQLTNQGENMMPSWTN